MSFYIEDDAFLGFDFVPPFTIAGTSAFRTQWGETFQTLKEDPTFELRDIAVHCSGDLAVAYGLSHFKAATDRGPIDVWTRQTNAFRNVDGRWFLIHEHVSVPIDMEHGFKGVIDFRP